MRRTVSRQHGDDNDGDSSMGTGQHYSTLSERFENKESGLILDVSRSCLSVPLFPLNIFKRLCQLSIVILRYSHLYILIEQFGLPYSGIRPAGIQSSIYRIQEYGLSFFLTTNLTL